MPKSRIPFFRFYPSDFMDGVRGLSAQEVGLYTMLLCRMYEESGPIEDNTLRLATYCGMREKTFTKTLDKLVALGKITRQDGMLSNHRAEIEISDRSHDLKNAIAAGKASAKKRQQNQSNGATGVQRAFNHTDTDTDTDTDIRDTNVSLCQNDAFDYFNAVAERAGWPKVQKITKARRSALSKRVKDCGGYDNWMAAMDRASRSDFLLGKATGTTPACFDWLNAPRNFTKLMEGNYDNRNNAPQRDTVSDATDRQIAFAARAARTPSEDCF